LYKRAIKVKTGAILTNKKSALHKKEMKERDVRWENSTLKEHPSIKDVDY